LSHIHIPDGVLPVWLWLGGYLVTLALVAVLSRGLRGDRLQGKIPLLALMSALMLVGMSFEFVPLAYHPNLAVIAGIVVGPGLGFLGAFVVTFLLALLGHGGITLVGLNSLLVGLEAVAGWGLFRLISRIPRLGARPGVAAAVSTVFALFLSTVAFLGVVWVSGAETSAFSDLPGQGVATAVASVNLARLAGVVLTLGAIGWLIEALIVGAGVSFLARVRPDIVRVAALPPAVIKSGDKA
jgi:cobalt/nickel transport system permease protein